MSSQILYDHRGLPIPDSETRKEAEERLKNYIQKFKSRFDDWFREHGMKRPPVYYNTEKKEWFWGEQ